MSQSKGSLSKKKQKPSISFIIPNFNKGDYIVECIKSLEVQTIPADEIIVIDDCSSDGSFEILKNLQKKYSNIILLRNEFNRGVSYSRNRGILESSSKYVCFLDSDDFIGNPMFIERISHFLKKDRLCYMQYKILDVNGEYRIFKKTKLVRKTKKISKSRIRLMVCLDVSNPFIPRNYVVSKELVIKAGLFDEEMSLYEDSDLICRLLNYTKPLLIGEYGPVYRMTTNGLSKAAEELHKKSLSLLQMKYIDWKCKLLLKIDKKIFRVSSFCKGRRKK